MSSSERIAVAAHLHVLLKRKTGRVIDTEWLATNQDYAREIVHFVRVKATEAGNAELTLWADKLEAVISAAPLQAPQTLAEQRAYAALNHKQYDSSEANTAEVSKEGPRYVAGLR
ncbi:MAG: hypothetical protein JWR60_3064 [Polaromonas sp.]|nr:hypothetical protein [Polaromonas sp.]